MQQLKMLYFPGICVCGNSKCCNSLDFVHVASQNAVFSRDFVHATLPMLYFPGILCMQRVRILCVQRPPRAAFSRNDACILGAPLGFTGFVPKQPFWASFDPSVGNPLVNTPAYFYRAYSERGRISNMYKYAYTYLIPGEYNMYNFRLDGRRKSVSQVLFRRGMIK